MIINHKLYVITNPRGKHTALHGLLTELGTHRRGACSEERHKISVGRSSQTLYKDGNDEWHGCSLVRWAWLPPWTVNKLRKLDFFVCHGLLDPAVFLDISWDNFLSTVASNSLDCRALSACKASRQSQGHFLHWGTPGVGQLPLDLCLERPGGMLPMVSPASWAPVTASLEGWLGGASIVLFSKQDLKIRRWKITVIAK